MSSEADQIKRMEKDDIVFTGYSGKVSFNEFDKYMFRYMRMRYGQTIGEKLWQASLPILEGVGRLNNAAFKAHCLDVLDSITIYNPSQAKLLTPDTSPFWTREWQTKWRKEQYVRLFDVTTLKCKGQALLSVEEVGIENASTLRKALKKQYGGASEDVKHREEIFENGMPDKGKKVFPKGVDIEAKLRQLFREWQELVLLCPEENKATYKYAKESELVKICLKHLKHTEYDATIKELLNDIKFDRKLARAMAGGNAEDAEDDNLEDWEYRNYKDDWIPSFEKLRDKLVGRYKEMKYDKVSHNEDDDRQSLPAMMTRAVLQKAVRALLAPGYGQFPSSFSSDTKANVDRPKMKCWACGLLGHKSGDSVCKAEVGAIHQSAPMKAKRKFASTTDTDNSGGPSNKRPNGICQYFKNHGTCRFGANCRNKHEANPNGNKGKGRGSKGKGKSRGSKGKGRGLAINALKAQVVKGIKAKTVDELDELVRGFLTVRTIPREIMEDEVLNVRYYISYY
jgi:hypothetical protein